MSTKLNKPSFKFDKSDDEERDYSDDYEKPEEQGFDLRGKSLKNTAPRVSEPKKESLPLKTIMKGILDRNDISELAKTKKVGSRLSSSIPSSFPRRK